MVNILEINVNIMDVQLDLHLVIQMKGLKNDVQLINLKRMKMSSLDDVNILNAKHDNHLVILMIKLQNDVGLINLKQI